MTDQLKIILNAHATIQRKKCWNGHFTWETIDTKMIPEEKQIHFLIDPNSQDLEKKIVAGLEKIDFSSFLAQVKLSYTERKSPLEALKHLLMDLFVELQDVKANVDDDDFLDLLNHMDAELVTAGKLVSTMKQKDDLVLCRDCKKMLRISYLANTALETEHSSKYGEYLQEIDKFIEKEVELQQ